MTFLEICQAVVREGNIKPDSVAPTTTVGQVGILASVVEWVDNEWIDIQALRHDWDFLRVHDVATTTTVAGQPFYTPTDFGVAGSFNVWDLDTFRVFLTTSGVQSEVYMEPDAFDVLRDTYLYSGARGNRTRPQQVGVRPSDHAILAVPVPATGYTITGDFYQMPVSMVNDSDVPGIRAQHHMTIVWGALWNYGYHAIAQESLDRAKLKYKEKRARLMAEYTPKMTAGGTL